MFARAACRRTVVATWTSTSPPPPTPHPKTHDNRKHSSHCGTLVKSPNEPPMPWRVRPRSVSSLCPCHLDLDPPPRHTPRPPRSTTTAITQHTAETPSNLQTNLRCHGVFARAACRRSVPVTWTSIQDNAPGQPRQRCQLHLSLEAVISNSFPHTSRGAANGTSKNHVPAMRSGGSGVVIETHAERSLCPCHLNLDSRQCPGPTPAALSPPSEPRSGYFKLLPANI